jgi:hypothetical protein
LSDGKTFFCALRLDSFSISIRIAPLGMPP